MIFSPLPPAFARPSLIFFLARVLSVVVLVARCRCYMSFRCDWLQISVVVSIRPAECRARACHMADALLGGEHDVGVVQALAGGRVEQPEGELVV